MTGPLVDLTGRHAVVTGGASGLGRATAQTLAGLGARVSVLDLDLPGAQATADQIRAAGGSADPVRCDVADPDDIAAAFGQVHASEPADILVNNAGINLRGASMEVSYADWMRTLAVNVTGYFLCARHFAGQLAPAGTQRAAIVNISSIGGSTSLGRGNFTYGVSKGAVEQMTRELAGVVLPVDGGNLALNAGGTIGE